MGPETVADELRTLSVSRERRPPPYPSVSLLCDCLCHYCVTVGGSYSHPYHAGAELGYHCYATMRLHSLEAPLAYRPHWTERPSPFCAVERVTVKGGGMKGGGMKGGGMKGGGMKGGGMKGGSLKRMRVPLCLVAWLTLGAAGSALLPTTSGCSPSNTRATRPCCFCTQVSGRVAPLGPQCDALFSLDMSTCRTEPFWIGFSLRTLSFFLFFLFTALYRGPCPPAG